MTMNIGSGYPMMMGGMGMGMNTGGNVPQYFQAKYGCEDCFLQRTLLAGIPETCQPRT